MTARGTTTRATHLFISPHLDDVALSCGGYVRRLADAGEPVVIATVITADPPPGASVSWLGRRSHAAWGLGDLPFAVRRREDEAAAEVLGASTRHLGLLDMIDRRDSNDEPLYTRRFLGVGVHPHDWEAFEPLARERLRAVLESVGSGVRLYCPLGAGGHVDHVVVRRAVESLGATSVAPASSTEDGAESADISYYEDYPYADRPGSVEAVLASGSSGGLGVTSGWQQITTIEVTVDELAARIAAVNCYASQVPGLFPSEAERLLEIARTRLPFLPWPRTWRPDSRTAGLRAAAALRRYVARVGGERFWRSPAGTDWGTADWTGVASHDSDCHKKPSR